MKLDLAFSYHQLWVRQANWWKTNFCSQLGQFEWNVVLFEPGTHSGPGLCGRFSRASASHLGHAVARCRPPSDTLWCHSSRSVGAFKQVRDGLHGRLFSTLTDARAASSGVEELLEIFRHQKLSSASSANLHPKP